MVRQDTHELPKIKSPLRYPGGKSRALKQILSIIPESFAEFREPFVGGGSVFLALKQQYPDGKYWINDLNQDLYLFWKYCQTDIDRLVSEVKKIKEQYGDGEELFHKLKTQNKTVIDIKRAVRFFVLNRITFSGTIDCGGNSKEAFKKRFTDSSINRLALIKPLLGNVSITNYDYEKALCKRGKDVFIFLDPPYFSTIKSKLYGKNGDLHALFDHERFVRNMKECRHKWLITYDNSPEVRDSFHFANIYEWELQYGMDNYKQKHAAKGQELFISNYDIPLLKDRKIN